MYKLSVSHFLCVIFLLFSININARNNKIDNATENNHIQISNNEVQLKEGNNKKYEFYLVKYEKLAIMDSPSSQANVIGTLAKGDTIKSFGFTTSSDKFHLITKLVKFEYKDQVGYVNSLYLRKIYQYSSVGEKPDQISIYAGLLFITSVMFLGLLAN